MEFLQQCLIATLIGSAKYMIKDYMVWTSNCHSKGHEE